MCVISKPREKRKKAATSIFLILFFYKHCVFGKRHTFYFCDTNCVVASLSLDKLLFLNHHLRRHFLNQKFYKQRTYRDTQWQHHTKPFEAIEETIKETCCYCQACLIHSLEQNSFHKATDMMEVNFKTHLKLFLQINSEKVLTLKNPLTVLALKCVIG